MRVTKSCRALRRTPSHDCPSMRCAAFCRVPATRERVSAYGSYTACFNNKCAFSKVLTPRAHVAPTPTPNVCAQASDVKKNGRQYAQCRPLGRDLASTTTTGYARIAGFVTSARAKPITTISSTTAAAATALARSVLGYSGRSVAVSGDDYCAAGAGEQQGGVVDVRNRRW